MRGSLRIAPLGAIVVAAFLSACGSSGSSTTCSDFRGMSLSDQKSVVTNILSQHGQSTSPLAVDGALLSAKGYCFTHSGSDTVGSIEGG